MGRARTHWWTAETDDYLRRHYDSTVHGRGIEIARILGVPAHQVRRRARQLGLGRPYNQPELYSASRIGRLLGVGNKAVTRWIRCGAMRYVVGHRAGTGRVRLVSPEELVHFLHNPKWWYVWDPANIPDPAFRELTERIRGGAEYWTTGQVASWFEVSITSVNNWIKRGLLDAVRHDNWLIRRTDAQSFKPPSHRRNGTEEAA